MCVPLKHIGWMGLAVVLVTPGVGSTSRASNSEPVARVAEYPPPSVVEAAWKLVESRVGSDFSRHYVEFLPDSTRSLVYADQGKCYRMKFSLTVPDLEISEDAISFTVAEDGSLVPGSTVLGLPDCVAHPTQCRLLVSRQMALLLASEHWQRADNEEWKASFRRDPTEGYLWRVASEWQQESLASWRRETVDISASTGQVVSSGGTIRYINI
jgi:hypothetical protein